MLDLDLRGRLAQRLLSEDLPTGQFEAPDSFTNELFGLFSRDASNITLARIQDLILEEAKRALKVE